MQRTPPPWLCSPCKQRTHSMVQTKPLALPSWMLPDRDSASLSAYWLKPFGSITSPPPKGSSSCSSCAYIQHACEGQRAGGRGGRWVAVQASAAWEQQRMLGSVGPVLYTSAKQWAAGWSWGVWPPNAGHSKCEARMPGCVQLTLLKSVADSLLASCAYSCSTTVFSLHGRPGSAAWLLQSSVHSRWVGSLGMASPTPATCNFAARTPTRTAASAAAQRTVPWWCCSRWPCPAGTCPHTCPRWPPCMYSSKHSMARPKQANQPMHGAGAESSILLQPQKGQQRCASVATSLVFTPPVLRQPPPHLQLSKSLNTASTWSCCESLRAWPLSPL